MGIKLGLDKIKLLLDRLGNPQEHLQFVHVAGTNGKGSICNLIFNTCCLLPSTRVGMFTSPHLVYEQESIQINLRMVSRDEFLKVKSCVIEANREIGASGFEILVSTAFQLFRIHSVDLVVLEVGMGGLLDATNIISPPRLEIISKITIDHVEFLGNTPAEIALHKAGILKKGTKECVFGPQTYKEAEDVLIHTAREKGIEIYMVKKCERNQQGLVLVEFPNEGEYVAVKPKLLGDYQLENIATAAKALSLLSKDYKITSEIVKKGFEMTVNPGRLQWINHNKYGDILLDGAHNQDGVIAFKNYLDSIRNDRKVAFIVGFSGNRDPRMLFDLVLQEGDLVYPVEFKSPEGMEWVKSANHKFIEECCKCAVECNGDLQNALEMIDRSKTPLVIIVGSLYLVGNALFLMDSDKQ